MNAYPDTRWVGLRFTFEFVDQEARQDAIPVSSGEAASSHIRDKDCSLSLESFYRWP